MGRILWYWILENKTRVNIARKKKIDHTHTNTNRTFRCRYIRKNRSRRMHRSPSAIVAQQVFIVDFWLWRASPTLAFNLNKFRLDMCVVDTLDTQPIISKSYRNAANRISWHIFLLRMFSHSTHFFLFKIRIVVSIEMSSIQPRYFFFFV